MYGREYTTLVDFLFHHGNNKQIFVKELAILDCDSLVPEHYHFMRPYCAPEMEVNGLPWSEGNIPYSNLEGILKALAGRGKVLLVQSVEKQKFLNKFLWTGGSNE